MRPVKRPFWNSCSRRLNASSSMAFPSCRNGKGFLNGPALAKAPVKAASAKASQATPLRLGQRHAAILKTRVGSVVVVLLQAGRPAAILWRIAFVVINAIKRVMRSRRLAHISKEMFKRFPAVANRNTPRTVIFESPVLRIGATLVHGLPNAPKWGFALAVRCQSLAQSLRGFLSGQAPARLGAAPSKVMTRNGLFSTAVTLTNPGGLVKVVGAVPAQNHQTAEPLAYKVYGWSHVCYVGDRGVLVNG